MKVGITGSNGFIGKSLCRYLESKSLSILKIQRNDLRNSILLNSKDSIFNLNGYLEDLDVVIHCAGLVHQKDNRNYDFHDYHKFNAFSTYNLALQASMNNVKKFIFLSSIKVNGESTNLNSPFVDPYCCNPSDHYSLSKLNAESYLRDLSIKTNLRTIILRVPLVYGKDVKANFRSLLNLVYRKVPLPFQNSNNKRSFLFIENLCDFIYKLVLDENSSKSNTFLLSDADSLSTKQLIKLISKGFKNKPNLFPFNESILNYLFTLLGKKETFSKLTNSLEIDPRPSYEALDWDPPFTIEEGILETAKWFKNQQESV